MSTNAVTRRPLGGLSLPIDRSTTFAVASAGEHRDRFRQGDPRFYQRFAHPTAEAAAAEVARLEGAEAGLVFSSGMGAIATTLVTLLNAGDHVVAHREIFDQTRTLLSTVLADYGVSVTFVDARDLGNVGAAITDQTRAVYIETPSNPLLHVIDIAGIARLAAPRNAELVVDGTFASPALQQPLRLGATIVLHSGTKFLGGHSDVMCGVVSSSAANIRAIRATQILLGTVLDPQAAWLLHRGTRTLDLRVRRQSDSALTIARVLERHPQVERVHYPFLPSDPGHAIASRQMSGGGGVVSFVVRGGRGGARMTLDRLTTIAIATSLGGVETVIELPYDLDFDDEQPSHDRAHVPGLVRLSVGLEDPHLLLEDLIGSLNANCPP